MPAGDVWLAWRLPNEFGSRQPPAVVEEPLIASQIRAPRNPTSKLVVTILGGVVTWERKITLERQREGIAKAKAEGKTPGAIDENVHGTEICADTWAQGTRQHKADR